MSIRLMLTVLVLGVFGSPSFAAERQIPRTASGRPDLSGSYDISSLTALERAPKFGDRLFLTAEEAAAIAKNEAAAIAFASRNSDPERDAPPDGGDGSPGAAGGVGGYNAFWIDRGTGATAVDGKFRTSILFDPPNGRLPPLSEEGKRRRQGAFAYAFDNNSEAWWLDHEAGPYDDPESLPPIVRCIYLSVASVPALPILYNNLKTIVQTEDHVVILVEWMHWARIIRLDSEHAPPAVRSRGGDSIGHWEGDTLVVDTTNFLDEGTVSGDLHAVERFTRVDADSVIYQFTIEDPSYAAPYSGEFTWPQTQDKLYEYACHEGNYAMGNILRGARIQEEEARKKKAAAGGQ